jgi:hypothetical protein
MYNTEHSLFTVLVSLSLCTNPFTDSYIFIPIDFFLCDEMWNNFRDHELIIKRFFTL